MTALAKRSVACKGWRWMPGMLALATSKHWPEHAPEPTRVDERQLSFDGEPVNDQWTAVPDLDDPATLGCLLALVREAWSEPRASATVVGRESAWTVAMVPRSGRHKTEIEALVAALEAAP